MELLVLLIFGITNFIFWAMIVQLLKKMNLISREKRILLYEGILLITICLMLMSIWASYELTPIKKEFKQIAMQGPLAIKLNGDGTWRSADYGGEIDSILKIRDMWLKNHHYHILGKWRIIIHTNQTTKTDFSTIYIWNPFI